MTIRTSTVRNVAGVVTAIVHAGPAPELSTLALEYAYGRRPAPRGSAPRHFEQAAQQLLQRSPAHHICTIRFWADAPDGTPFQGPRGYRPDEDPHHTITSLMTAPMPVPQASEGAHT